MQNIEKAALVLKSSDLSTVGNQNGIKNALRTSFTWNNISLRTLLGPMYDKYDTFNLTLNSISCALVSAQGTITNNGND